jgi:hypothetical protein
MGIFCPSPQKGLFQELAREILWHGGLHQGVNNRWQVHGFWPLGALGPPAQMNLLPGHGSARNCAVSCSATPRIRQSFALLPVDYHFTPLE